MHNAIRLGARALAVVSLAVALTPPPASRAFARTSPLLARPQDAPPPSCCFTNRNYAGTCEVRPSGDETCGQILQYLNNPLSQGKTYCNSTSVRGGWESVSCESKR